MCASNPITCASPSTRSSHGSLCVTVHLFCPPRSTFADVNTRRCAFTVVASQIRHPRVSVSARYCGCHAALRDLASRVCRHGVDKLLDEERKPHIRALSDVRAGEHIVEFIP
jgi:hypothetical protein